MANTLGSRLSRLVRERAYISGSISSLKKDIVQAEANLCAMTRRLDLVLQRLADVDEQIAALSAIDVSGIAAIRPTPRLGQKEYGSIRRTIIDLMKRGQPISTAELIQLMTPIFEWNLSTRSGREYAIDAVREPLRRFKNKGVVERLPDQITQTGRRCGVWRWIGPQDND